MMHSLRRQVSECSTLPPPPPHPQPSHLLERTRSFNDGPFTKKGSYHRSVSTCSLTNRNFLRKRILELKELEGGIRSGCRVICHVEGSQEEGVVKWVGQINQVTFVGVEFENPIGINFPETKGAPPFPCKLGHTRLVLQKDLLFVQDPSSQTVLLDKIQRIREMELGSKLEDFYSFCLQAEDEFDEVGVALDEALRGQGNTTLDRHRAFLNEVEDKYAIIDAASSLAEELFTYEDVLLPSEERKVNRTLETVTGMHRDVESRLKRRIASLEKSRTLQDALHGQREALDQVKSRVRGIDNSLIKSQAELADRLEEVKGLHAWLIPVESPDIQEIIEALAEEEDETFEEEDLDFEAQLSSILTLKATLGTEVTSKVKTLEEAQVTYGHFLTLCASFETWYVGYFKKICQEVEEGQGHGQDLHLVQEREVKREEFLGILQTARKLRISIFDSSALDDRIQDLQAKWRALMDRCYRDRFRKTV